MPENTTRPDLVPVTSWSRTRQHLARPEQLQDDTERPGKYGKALCNQDSVRVYDQAWMTAEWLRYFGEPGTQIVDLPPCKRCERSAERMAVVSGGSGASGVTR